MHQVSRVVHEYQGSDPHIMSKQNKIDTTVEIKSGTRDAELFIDDVRGSVTAISAEIDRSQTRREYARQKGWEYSMAFEQSYENRLRKEIQNG